MKTVKVSEIFSVRYGVNLELNSLTKNLEGIHFVSRTEKNNGVPAIVNPVSTVEPIPAGTISVAGGGSVMASFLQTQPYYSGRDLYYLTSRHALSDQEKIYYCECLKKNSFRYNYGRQANKTLANLLIPSIDSIPDRVNLVDINQFNGAEKPVILNPVSSLETSKWQEFTFDELFKLKKGKRLTKANMVKGNTPFTGAIDSNNGYRQYVDAKPNHQGNTITVNYNGSVAEAFYQPSPYWASDDVNVLYPRFEMTPFMGLFLCTIFKLEKFRFNYGRKWHLDRMKVSRIKLPVDNAGNPNWQFMEDYIKSLPYSSSI